MPSRFSRLIPLMVTAILSLMSLACWSSDTLIIRPTITPIPTVAVPTPNFVSKYAIGEKVSVVTTGIAPLYITERPEPPSRSNRVANAACYAATVVTIEAVQQVDSVTYYQITCNNLPGWVSEKLLSGGK
ncbi:MAG: hypothetical protein H0X30_21235 [Anaerolineae bacterium]|nr:hypothetical protein [Anaerolineae bacterium]